MFIAALFCVVGKEQVYMNIKRERKTGEGQLPTRIIVERVYLGGQSMEDAFRKINEETVRENIEKIMKKAI